MDDIPLDLLFVLGGLILLSAFFSSAETALSSVNKIRMRNYANENRPGSKKALSIVENFDNALSTILVGNNIVNIAAASISAKVATDLFGASAGLVVSTFGMTILVLVFGEILPKSIAKEHAEAYTLRISGIMYWLVRLLTPINFLFRKMKAFVSRMFSKPENQPPSVTEEEIKVLIDISEEEGVINKEEKELVHRSLDFNEILVKEILTPRPDIVAVEVDQPIEEIKRIFFHERYSRIPVYEKNIDNIIGILSQRDFLEELVKHGTVDIRKLLRKPLYVVKSMRISNLLEELQKSKGHMSIVIDEFGGTSGLITLEDILEELVGEIWDEHDERLNMSVKVDEHTYEFDAQVQLDEFSRLLNLPEIESSYHSLGGWISEKTERIPQKGDSFEYENTRITITEVEKKRIRKVKVELTQPSGLE